MPIEVLHEVNTSTPEVTRARVGGCEHIKQVHDVYVLRSDPTTSMHLSPLQDVRCAPRPLNVDTQPMAAICGRLFYHKYVSKILRDAAARLGPSASAAESRSVARLPRAAMPSCYIIYSDLISRCYPSFCKGMAIEVAVVLRTLIRVFPSESSIIIRVLLSAH